MIRGPFRNLDNIVTMLQLLRKVKIRREYFKMRVPKTQTITKRTAQREAMELGRMLREQDFLFDIYREDGFVPDSVPGLGLPSRGFFRRS